MIGDVNLCGVIIVIETLDPEVKILSLAIVSPGRQDLVLPIPDGKKINGTWFTLKEGSRYTIKFTFQVCNNIVSGLKYTNTVWKTGIKGMIHMSHQSKYMYIYCIHMNTPINK